MPDKGLVIEDVSKIFFEGSNKAFAAVKSINMTISEGDAIALIGPSGCGKTTLLNLIAGIDSV